MDINTQKTLIRYFEDSFERNGFQISADARVRLLNLLKKAQNVDQSQLPEVMQSTQHIVFLAINEALEQGVSGRISSVHIDAALNSLCPLWPFC